MKTNLLHASIAVFASGAIAQATPTSSKTATLTSATPSCTASVITTLCDYPSPGPDFAVAIENRASCLAYCNDHQPCDFVIFAAGNPNIGSGTCWLYPGKTFNASAGNSTCQSPSLTVFSKPSCAGGSPTTSGGCAATASPSAVASVCGYPPPGDCFDGCVASESASSCLSQCAKVDSCSYVVFNPHNPSGSPFAPGTCWIYPNGTYNAASTGSCRGGPEQYVYNNTCPKPSLSPSSAVVLSSATRTSNGVGATGTPGASNTVGKSSAAATLSFNIFVAVSIAALASCLQLQG